MRTNIVLNDALVAEAIGLSHARSKREVVDLALRELVERYRQRQLAQLKGQNLIEPSYDIRQLRRNMNRDAG